MNASYLYAAYSYLDEWMSVDLPCHEALATEASEKMPATKAVEKLVEFATHYSVMRTLPLIGEAQRLDCAYHLLMNAATPTDRESAVRVVDSFAEQLGETY